MKLSVVVAWYQSYLNYTKYYSINAPGNDVFLTKEHLYFFMSLLIACGNILDTRLFDQLAWGRRLTPDPYIVYMPNSLRETWDAI